LGVQVHLVLVDTSGDLRRDRSISSLGGQGVFVKEVQSAVLEGRADLAVHSAKDLPSAPTPGLVLAAVPERGDPRDALVGRSLEQLAPGALVATGSVRRRAQLAWLRPDLTFTDLRGNIGTRLEKVPPGGAVVVAVAALDRLGCRERATQVLEPGLMLPQVAQGALAIECREHDVEVNRLLGAIDDLRCRAMVEAERSFLSEMGAGCDLPIAAHSRPAPHGLELDGLIASPDGSVLLRQRASGSDPVALGREVAFGLLDGRGGRALLQSAGRP
jgi:hydroxymethylbilane synthase